MSAQGMASRTDRIIAFLLVILMMLTILPHGSTARAEEEHTHEGWTAIEALPTESGSYYLTKDIEISRNWTIGSGTEINLCLNDHSITMTAAGFAIIINGGTLNLYDCGTTERSYTAGSYPATVGSGSGSFTGGYITHTPGKTGGVVQLSSGRFNMYGGAFIGSDNTRDQRYSGAVDLTGGTFNLYGGTIAGNKGSERLGGGGVYKSGGSINLYGGEIKHNYASYGGGLLMWYGTVTMDGVSIHHNSANQAGGLQVASGRLIISSGNISDNTANICGGLVINGTCDMSGGSITGNTSPDEYGAVSTNGTFNLSGGSITGNKSEGGGLKVNEGTLNISGNPVVTGNHNEADVEMNLYLPAGTAINVTGTMTEGASVGITTETVPTAGNPVSFGLKYKDSNTDAPDNWFFSDKGFDVILRNDDSDKNAYVAARVTIAYDGNGADSGDVPAAKTVIHGTTVKVADAGKLKKAGSVFDHWTTVPEGGRASYAPGDEIALEGNMTLYVSWVAGHTVTWLNWDESILDEKQYLEGEEKPTTEKTPTREPDDNHTYVFKEWEEVTVADGDTIYTPVFTAVPIPTYTVTWLDGDGSILDEKEYKEGKSKPTTDKVPTKAEDNRNTYVFDKWVESTDQDGNTIYKPVFRIVAKPTAGPTAAPSATPTATIAPTATPNVTAAPTAAPEPTATPRPVPKTGDREDVLLWAEILALCLTMLVVLMAVRSGQRRKQ